MVIQLVRPTEIRTIKQLISFQLFENWTSPVVGAPLHLTSLKLTVPILIAQGLNGKFEYCRIGHFEKVFYLIENSPA